MHACAIRQSSKHGIYVDQYYVGLLLAASDLQSEICSSSSSKRKALIYYYISLVDRITTEQRNKYTFSATHA